MNKNILTLIGILAVVIVGIVIFANRNNQPTNTPTNDVTSQETEEMTENIDSNMESQLTENEETAQVVAAVMTDGEYEVSAMDSTLTWEGRKPKIIGYKDVGTLALSSGNFQIANGLLTSGGVVINMSTLTSTNVSKGSTDGLTKHLRSADFFDTDNFPEATIKLISAQPGEMAGTYNLETEITIKGITNPVIIPAQVVSENNQVIISGHAELDRTLWNVRFGSGKFFENLADNVIDDNFGVDFRFVANLK
jgi:polyisoprenoid-binding protein YceI